MLCEHLHIDTVSGDNGEGVPPVPIPNTEVKPFSADGTWLDTARESRSSPDPIQKQSVMVASFSIILSMEKMVLYDLGIAPR